MFCPWCRTEQPDFSTSCKSCGRTFRNLAAQALPGRRFEYQNLVVELNIDARIFPSQSAVREHCNRVISTSLRAPRRQGWEPAGAADWDGLWAAGRIKVRSGVYEYVNVELRRPSSR